MNFLSKVKKYKQTEIQNLEKKQNRFEKLFATNRKNPVFIAEIKPKSPSEGILYDGDFVKLAKTYEEAGVDAISVLTDKPSFGGDLNLLHNISQNTTIPILRKDFILSRSQVVESLKNHADALLLIVSLLNEEKLSELINFSYELGIAPVVEVVSKSELKIAIKAGAKIIGVNARNLKTLKVNNEHALEVLKIIPKTIVPLLFSGIKTRQDIYQAVKVGAKGILVGTSLLKATNIPSKIKELRNDYIVKICGIKDVDSAKNVIRQKPDMIGLNFVPTSIRRIDIRTAKSIAKLAKKQNISIVGVFQNQPLKEVLKVINSIPLDYVQLHGDEDYCTQIPIPIIKKITLDNIEEQINKYKEEVDIFLIDRPKQGKGPLVNEEKVKILAQEYPILIAGGLNSNNVASVILQVGRKLLGVDVSGGVEHVAGVKDEQLVGDFIQESRRTYEKF